MLLLLFGLVALVQLFVWGRVLGNAYPDPEPEPVVSRNESGVSVIVCFRNEEATLSACVEAILAQTYPGPFELLLVDDNSTDRSASVVHPFVIRYEHVRLLEPGPTRPGKKDALAHGIAAARYDHLLLTDADCVPASSHWLWWMTRPLREGQDLVLGVSPLLPGKTPGLLDWWQWYESVYVSLKYLGFAHRGRPYMGVGRNLAYTRGFYERADGFAAHADLPGGDDDLLVAGNAEAHRTATVTHPAAWTHSRGPQTWRAYFRQRRRHQSTGPRYPRRVGLRLGRIALTHGLFYLLGFALLLSYAWPLAVGTYALRWLLVCGAFARPLLFADPGAAAVAEHGRSTGAEMRTKSWVWLGCFVMVGDLLAGPMYLFLVVSGWRKAKDW